MPPFSTEFKVVWGRCSDATSAESEWTEHVSFLPKPDFCQRGFISWITDQWSDLHRLDFRTFLCECDACPTFPNEHKKHIGPQPCGHLVFMDWAGCCNNGRTVSVCSGYYQECPWYRPARCTDVTRVHMQTHRLWKTAAYLVSAVCSFSLSVQLENVILCQTSVQYTLNVYWRWCKGKKSQVIDFAFRSMSYYILHNIMMALPHWF